MAQPAQRARKIVGMTVMSSIAAILALFGTVSWLSGAANMLAADQSRKLIESELNAVSGDLSLIVRHTGRWDSAHDWVTRDDAAAIIANIGSGASDRGPFNFLYIINSVGTPLYAFEEEKLRTSAIGYNLELVNVVRSELNDVPLEPYRTVSGYVATQGRIAMASAGRIQRIDASGLNVHTTPILIAARWFDQSDVEDIGTRLQMNQLRLDYWDSVRREGTLSVPLLDISGRPIAHVSWWPPRPGDQLMDRVKPVIVVIAVIMLLSGFVVGRVATRQTNALIEEMQMARTDNLTGLLNRTGLEQVVDTDTVQNALRLGQLAVLYVDMNDFKPLNDTFGHCAGDEVLREVAARLGHACRRGDFVVRLGGDEFLCILIDPDPAAAVERVTAIIRQNMSEPIRLAGEERSITVSLGHAIAGAGTEWTDLIFAADEAMYQEKDWHRAKGQSVA